MKPVILAIAVLTALTASIVMTGVAKAAVWAMTADLTAEAEVPAAGPAGATGSAFISIDDETNEVCFELTIDGLADDDSVIAAHIHEGAAGVAGDVVVPLFTEPPTGEMTGACRTSTRPSLPPSPPIRTCITSTSIRRTIPTAPSAVSWAFPASAANATSR